MSEPISYTNKSKMDVFEGIDPAIKVRTKKMLMYLIIFAVIMIFAGLTSAYIVINAGKFWVHAEAPQQLWMSNGIIVLSSLTLIFALRSAKAGNSQTSLMLLLVTFVLGLAFTFTQYQGWNDLASKGMGFTIRDETGIKVSSWNRIEGITAEYGVDYYVHKDGQKLILENGEFYMPDDQFRTSPVTYDVRRTSNMSSSFIAVLIVVHLIHLALGLIYLLVLIFRTLKGRINKDNTISLYAGGMYWHFLGILWVYLFLFLFFIH